MEKIGRNDPCPCGSGKKFKKCHGQEAGKKPIQAQVIQSGSQKMSSLFQSHFAPKSAPASLRERITQAPVKPENSGE